MYALFAGQTYDPNGGWADHKKSSHDVRVLKDQALAEVADGVDWWHIINLATGEVVDHWKTPVYDNRDDPVAGYDPQGHGVDPLF